MAAPRTPPDGQSTLSSAGPAAPPDVLQLHELGRIRAAAQHATKVYPGPVGELIARELLAHAEFGYRFQDNGLLRRVARQVLALAPVRTRSGR